MEASQMGKGTLVIGVIGDDVHSIGISVLERALTEAGFKVVSLGVLVFQEEFVNAAVETKADAILVSSLNGHAPISCLGFRDKCIEAGLSDIILYLGGMLLMRDMNWEEIEKMFRDMGFDRVYPPSVMPSEVISDLEADLRGKRG